VGVVGVVGVKIKKMEQKKTSSPAITAGEGGVGTQ